MRLFLQESLEEWPGNSFDLLSENVVIETSQGRVYVGHEGFTQWYTENARRHVNLRFALDRLDEREDGWVIVEGKAEITRRDGELLLQPGAWALRVEGERIIAILFFRTREEAEAGVTSR